MTALKESRENEKDARKANKHGWVPLVEAAAILQPLTEESEDVIDTNQNESGL